MSSRSRESNMVRSSSLSSESRNDMSHSLRSENVDTSSPSNENTEEHKAPWGTFSTRTSKTPTSQARNDNDSSHWSYYNSIESLVIREITKYKNNLGGNIPSVQQRIEDKNDIRTIVELIFGELIEKIKLLDLNRKHFKYLYPTLNKTQDDTSLFKSQIRDSISKVVKNTRTSTNYLNSLKVDIVQKQNGIFIEGSGCSLKKFQFDELGISIVCDTNVRWLLKISKGVLKKFIVLPYMLLNEEVSKYYTKIESNDHKSLACLHDMQQSEMKKYISRICEFLCREVNKHNFKLIISNRSNEIDKRDIKLESIEESKQKEDEEESNNESIHQPVSSLANAKKNFSKINNDKGYLISRQQSGNIDSSSMSSDIKTIAFADNQNINWSNDLSKMMTEVFDNKFNKSILQKFNKKNSYIKKFFMISTTRIKYVEFKERLRRDVNEIKPIQYKMKPIDDELLNYTNSVKKRSLYLPKYSKENECFEIKTFWDAVNIGVLMIALQIAKDPSEEQKETPKNIDVLFPRYFKISNRTPEFEQTQISRIFNKEEFNYVLSMFNCNEEKLRTVVEKVSRIEHFCNDLIFAGIYSYYQNTKDSETSKLGISVD